uniref:Sulfate exporter family transporter n=1 Tax=Ditylum brightwellii TaxID=49249 RepID=A0A7S4WF35_9STRA
MTSIATGELISKVEVNDDAVAVVKRSCKDLGVTVKTDLEAAEHFSGEDEDSFKENNGGVKPSDVVPDSSTRKMTKQCLPQLKKIHTTGDWWSLWIGLASFILAIALVFTVQYDHGSSRIKYVIPQPKRWETNPFEAWDLYGVIGTVLLLAFLCSLYLVSQNAMGKLESKPVCKYIKGFFSLGGIATLAFGIGRNKYCYLSGFGYAIFSIIFGMLITNSPLASGDRLSSLKIVAKDGEFFIKCSLALLATPFGILGEVGVGSLVVAWVGSPIALVLGFVFANQVLKMDTGLALLIATGATWCGASAISAIGSVIDAPGRDISLSISVVAFFTIFFTFAQPYLALGVGMNERIAGAWIGGSVDQTGNVIASAAIISEEATEVAAIVKIVLNSGLGILATAVAFIWQLRGPKDETKAFSWMFLWDKFPKFVLGYLLCSTVLSVLLPFIEGTAEADALQRAIITMNTWWFALGFVGVGMGTNIKELWHGARKSGIIQGYLVTNIIDIAISFGLSYAMF